MIRRIFLTVCLACVPLSAAASDDLLTRREGFIQMWESIARNIYNYRDVPYTDVAEGTEGYREITYARQRGLLQNDAYFHPEEPLTLEHALIMLMRLENITYDPDEVNESSLSSHLERYPIAYLDTETAGHHLSRQELFTMISRFDELLAEEEHEVSLYAEKFHGKGTAFGDTFNMYDFTAAHRTYPANTLVRVTNVDNGKSVIVRINDRGPFVAGRDMDLSLAAFTAIEHRSKGKFMARFERLGDHDLVSYKTGPLDGTIVDDTYVTLNNEVPPSTEQLSPQETPSQHAAEVLADEVEEGRAPDLQTCVPLADRYMQRVGGIILRHGLPHQLALGREIVLSGPDSFVVRSVYFPDGNMSTVQNWVLTHEEYRFKPSIAGLYTFRLDDSNGYGRELTVDVKNCN